MNHCECYGKWEIKVLWGKNPLQKIFETKQRETQLEVIYAAFCKNKEERERSRINGNVKVNETYNSI